MNILHSIKREVLAIWRALTTDREQYELGYEWAEANGKDMNVLELSNEIYLTRETITYDRQTVGHCDDFDLGALDAFNEIRYNRGRTLSYPEMDNE